MSATAAPGSGSDAVRQSTTAEASSSQAFHDAMKAVTVLRDAERARKGDEFRCRMVLADLGLALSQAERSWKAINQGSSTASRHDDPQQGVGADPSLPSRGNATELPLSAISEELAFRVDRLCADMTSALSRAASSGVPVLPKESSVPGSPDASHSRVPLQYNGVVDAADRSGTLSSTLATSANARKERGPASVTLVGDELSSQFASACFSPRANRKSSFQIADSVSFIPQEAFQPNSDDQVSRGCMTVVRLTATSGTQTSATPTSARKSVVMPEGRLTALTAELASNERMLFALLREIEIRSGPEELTNLLSAARDRAARH